MSLRGIPVSALCAALPAILLAKIWLLVTPARAVRWAMLAMMTTRTSVPVASAPSRDARSLALSRAIAGIGRRRPLRATCLEQGVALVMLLSVYRVPSRLVVGVARPGAALRAHAWVECDGRILLGAAHAHGLTPLVTPSLCRG